MIEKISPFEVAESAAVGRALGFAGFGELESIATADEIIHAGIKGGSAGPEESICTCGTKGRFHAKDCPARLIQAKNYNLFTLLLS